MRCAVAKCNTDNMLKNFSSDLMLFRFPVDEEIKKRWVIACKREDKINVKTARVCSKHFDANSYERNLKFELLGYSARNRRLLKRDAVPFLNLPLKNAEGEKKNLARKKRIDKRNRTKVVESILEYNSVNGVGSGDYSRNNNNVEVDANNASTNIQLQIKTTDECTKRDISTNTETDTRDETIANLRAEVEKLKNDNNVLKNIFSTAQINKLKETNKWKHGPLKTSKWIK